MDRLAKARCAFTGVVGGVVPRGRLGGGELFGDDAAGVGEARHLLAVLVVVRDEAFVGEQLDGRVDRTRARAPGLAAALADLEDHLVAVHRAFEQQQQRCGANVAAPSTRAAAHRGVGPEAEAATAPPASPSPWTAERSVEFVFVIVFAGSWIHWCSPCSSG